MTLTEKTRAALAALAPLAGDGHTLSVEHEGQRLVCQLTALDRLACEFDRLALTSDRLAQASMDQLQRISEALSKRLTYLLEPIHPIEVDAEQCVVQMRSQPPQREEQSRSYYELLVREGGEICLRRWIKDTGEERRPLAAQVTREVLLRLVGDFSAAAG